VQAADVAGEAFLLDVREDDEWSAGHIEGALHVPLMTLPQRMAEVPSDREVVVVCRVGGRSEQAVHFLVQNGIDAFNLDGGMFAWEAAGRPIVSGSTDAEPFVL
jgi:rhodanese-related sulfurtransferase